MAPTGSGKTWIAEQAILSVFQRGGRCWYASPLKALSNAKWVEFSHRFGAEHVGILTGDTKENPDAPIIVGTTEILRNQLYDVMQRGGDLRCDLVILDEAHYLGDRDRGVVWEEIMIYLPVRVNLLLLSATIGNGDEIAAWLSTTRKKTCAVIREEKRPVPLFPLFLHPSGRMMPLMESRKLYGKVTEYIVARKTRRLGKSAALDFGEVIHLMEAYDLLPAIFFLKSRSECDAALKSCTRLAEKPSDERFYYDLEELLSRFPFLRQHRQLQCLIDYRVAAHHGGQLPAWKFFVETMMKKGHLRAIFATSTVAAGVNYPARTIVLFNSDLFNGHEFCPLSGTEFHQMTGRAGRRGLDNIGFMLAVPGRFMDLIHVKKLLYEPPDEIVSQIRNDFSMVLNLLLSQTPETIRDIFENSLASYQHQKLNLWKEFLRHLEFLKAEGFVDASDRLTENGIWASQLRLDQPLLIAEGLRTRGFPEKDEKLLAALVAPFVYDSDQELLLDKRSISRKLSRAFIRLVRKLGPLTERMTESGFPVQPLYFWTSIAVYAWASGEDWDAILERLGVSDGEMAMLILRTADNLRQIASLKETHPEMADLAMKARDAILREPVVFEWEG
ncbi:Helicase conserved C-terminal domain-containing protein [Syntrophus gentianae]|uniref:Helicase conserved C-terminal domain-containing protein n=2 Tax=Syntrophus gentianae TaxID=43775 RepID=A0A1H7X6E5_9BACT|nr:Helicase conserved C-terminal domain-containing protein [Syntrophus gentianae]